MRRAASSGQPLRMHACAQSLALPGDCLASSRPLAAPQADIPAAPASQPVLLRVFTKRRDTVAPDPPAALFDDADFERQVLSRSWCLIWRAMLAHSHTDDCVQLDELGEETLKQKVSL